MSKISCTSTYVHRAPGRSPTWWRRTMSGPQRIGWTQRQGVLNRLYICHDVVQSRRPTDTACRARRVRHTHTHPHMCRRIMIDPDVDHDGDDMRRSRTCRTSASGGPPERRLRPGGETKNDRPSRFVHGRTRGTLPGRRDGGLLPGQRRLALWHIRQRKPELPHKAS